MDNEKILNLMKYSISKAIAKEMQDKALINKNESVKFTVKAAEKNGITLCSSPHCRIQTITTK